jgi:hypothetical protein
MLGWTLWDISGRFATFGDVSGSWGMFREVGGRFATSGDVLGCLEHKTIYCITIYKQVSTCSKDDAIIPRGLAGLD